MSKLTFSKLGLKPIKNTIQVIFDGVETPIEVKTYLPQTEKAELIKFVVDNAIDETTGTFSPIRIETFFSIAIVKWYADISFTEKQIAEAAKTYDALESTGFFIAIMKAIPGEEYQYITKVTNETIEAIERYNTSFSGIISSMTGEASSFNEQLTDILSKIQNREGLEELSAIRDIMGKDE